MIKLSRVLPIAALGIALTAGINNRAEAYAYAYSDLYVTGGVVTISNGGGITVLPASKSTASAALGGSGTSTNSAGSLADAKVAVGDGSTWPTALPTNNSWTLEGGSATNNYSWADSQIISEQTAVTAISTRQIAEGNSTDATLGSSNSETSSVTSMTFAVGSGGGTFKFDFSAALNMLAEITSPHTGIQALANAKIEITIRNALGVDVFNWVAGTDTGTGVASATNAFFLTSSVSVITTGAQALNESGLFSVTSTTLPEGTFQLALSASVSEGVQAHAIPAPGILTLFGLGLVMLGFMQRRNKITTKLAA